MTPEEREEPRLIIAKELAAVRLDALEEAARIAESRCNIWRSEADTYAEDGQAKFVRNIRAGEAGKIAASIRERAKE